MVLHKRSKYWAPIVSYQPRSHREIEHFLSIGKRQVIKPEKKRKEKERLLIISPIFLDFVRKP
jgi:hypothetical protein